MTESESSRGWWVTLRAGAGNLATIDFGQVTRVLEADDAGAVLVFANGERLKVRQRFDTLAAYLGAPDLDVEGAPIPPREQAALPLAFESTCLACGTVTRGGFLCRACDEDFTRDRALSEAEVAK